MAARVPPYWKKAVEAVEQAIHRTTTRRELVTCIKRCFLPGYTAKKTECIQSPHVQKFFDKIGKIMSAFTAKSFVEIIVCDTWEHGDCVVLGASGTKLILMKTTATGISKFYFGSRDRYSKKLVTYDDVIAEAGLYEPFRSMAAYMDPGTSNSNKIIRLLFEITAVAWTGKEPSTMDRICSAIFYYLGSEFQYPLPANAPTQATSSKVVKIKKKQPKKTVSCTLETGNVQLSTPLTPLVSLSTPMFDRLALLFCTNALGSKLRYKAEPDVQGRKTWIRFLREGHEVTFGEANFFAHTMEDLMSTGVFCGNQNQDIEQQSLNLYVEKTRASSQGETFDMTKFKVERDKAEKHWKLETTSLEQELLRKLVSGSPRDITEACKRSGIIRLAELEDSACQRAVELRERYLLAVAAQQHHGNIFAPDHTTKKDLVEAEAKMRQCLQLDNALNHLNPYFLVAASRGVREVLEGLIPKVGDSLWSAVNLQAVSISFWANAEEGRRQATAELERRMRSQRTLEESSRG